MAFVTAHTDKALVKVTSIKVFAGKKEVMPEVMPTLFFTFDMVE